MSGNSVCVQYARGNRGVVWNVKHRDVSVQYSKHRECVHAYVLVCKCLEKTQHRVINT